MTGKWGPGKWGRIYFFTARYKAVTIFPPDSLNISDWLHLAVCCASREAETPLICRSALAKIDCLCQSWLPSVPVKCKQAATWITTSQCSSKGTLGRHITIPQSQLSIALYLFFHASTASLVLVKNRGGQRYPLYRRWRASRLEGRVGAGEPVKQGPGSRCGLCVSAWLKRHVL